MACTKCKEDIGVEFTIPGSNTTIQLGKGVDKSKFISDYKKGKKGGKKDKKEEVNESYNSKNTLVERFQELAGITPLYAHQILTEKKFGWKDIGKAKRYCDRCYSKNRCCQFGGGGADYVKINCVRCGKKGNDGEPIIKKLTSAEIKKKLGKLKPKGEK